MLCFNGNQVEGYNVDRKKRLEKTLGKMSESTYYRILRVMDKVGLEPTKTNLDTVANIKKLAKLNGLNFEKALGFFTNFEDSKLNLGEYNHEEIIKFCESFKVKAPHRTTIYRWLKLENEQLITLAILTYIYKEKQNAEQKSNRADTLSG